MSKNIVAQFRKAIRRSCKDEIRVGKHNADMLYITFIKRVVPKILRPFPETLYFQDNYQAVSFLQNHAAFIAEDDTKMTCIIKNNEALNIIAAMHIHGILSSK